METKIALMAIGMKGELLNSGCIIIKKENERKLMPPPIP